MVRVRRVGRRSHPWEGYIIAVIRYPLTSLIIPYYREICYNDFMEELREILKKAIFELFEIDFEPEIVVSPENIEADYSSNVPLRLAKELHDNPFNIAEKISEKIDNAFASKPGFVNFRVADEILKNKINSLSEKFEVSSDEFGGKTVICEFSDPNPFKVLHVGHLYTSVVGDAISRLFEYAGAKVVRANFGGDVGLHVAKTMYILKQKNPVELTIEDIARCYVEGTAVYEDDEGARAEITELNKEIYKINAENIHEGELDGEGQEVPRRLDVLLFVGTPREDHRPDRTQRRLLLRRRRTTRLRLAGRNGVRLDRLRRGARQDRDCRGRGDNARLR